MHNNRYLIQNLFTYDFAFPLDVLDDAPSLYPHLDRATIIARFGGGGCQGNSLSPTNDMSIHAGSDVICNTRHYLRLNFLLEVVCF